MQPIKEGGRVAVDEALSFYTCGAISILFQRTISDSLSSSILPTLISLTNQSENTALGQTELGRPGSASKRKIAQRRDGEN
jgi:hypothetical protein